MNLNYGVALQELSSNIMIRISTTDLEGNFKKNYIIQCNYKKVERGAQIIIGRL